MTKEVSKISELVEFVASIKTSNVLVFRGEKKDYGETALFPFIYRKKYINKEDVIYRESQRFNDENFTRDKTTFDKLSRIQHYSAPTRLIDVSEDLLSAVYFAIAEKDDADRSDAIIYILEIDQAKIKYYDSDSVSVISNLVKIPLHNQNEKSKEQIAKDALCCFDNVEQFNKAKSSGYLLHEIKEEKSYFHPLIIPQHIFSIQFVLPKLTSSRIRSQKGAFLLFGLNPRDVEKSIEIIRNGRLIENIKDVDHPIVKIHTVTLMNFHIKRMKEELINLGIRKSFIYPEIDKVSEYLKTKYENA